MNKLRIGILGCGEFSEHFARLFLAHPNVEKIAVADIKPERAQAFGKMFNCEYCYSFDELLEMDINTVAIFTPRHTHGPIAVEALKHGCHVYSAVPMASEITHCEEIIRLVNETGLTYMMGETCIYYPSSMFCKEKLESGEMGRFVYGEAQYYHDLAHFSDDYRSQPATLGVPPFFYPTHSTSMLLHATGSYVTKVTAMGYVDQEDDPYFKVGINLWDNVYSNGFSLMRLANGGVIRVNECRRIGWKAPSSSVSAFYGTKGGYQFSNAQHVFVKHTEGGVELTDVSDYVNPIAMTENKTDPDFKNRVANHDWQWDSFSPIHKTDRLPAEFANMPNGHMGSHQLLVDDFCTAAVSGKLPTVNAWLAARFTVPGLMAHESMLKDGVPMDVPDFGEPPADWRGRIL